MLLNGNPGGFVFFLRRTARKGGSIFLGGCDLHRNYGMVVGLLSFLCNNENLTLKLHQGKRCYPDEACLIIDRFKVWSVPRMSVALETSCLSIPAESTPESSPVKMRPTSQSPVKKVWIFNLPGVYWWFELPREKFWIADVPQWISQVLTFPRWYCSDSLWSLVSSVSFKSYTGCK